MNYETVTGWIHHPLVSETPMFRTVRPLLTYLAVPYTHRDPAVKEARYVAATKAAAWLMENNDWNVLSPITHSHPLHTLGGMRGDWDRWKKIDTEFIELSENFVLFRLPGWEESVGVTAERAIAKQFHLNLFTLDLVNLDKPDYELARVEEI